MKGQIHRTEVRVRNGDADPWEFRNVRSERQSAKRATRRARRRLDALLSREVPTVAEVASRGSLGANIITGRGGARR